MGYVDGDERFLPLYGVATQLDAATLRAGRPLDRDGVLVYPMCARDHAVCVVSTLSKAALSDSQWPLLLVCTVLGAGAGAAVGLALLLAHLRRRSVEGRLLRAIEQDALVVECQPVVRITDGALVGAQARVRWRDRDGRMVSPVRFIPIAEENGSIGRITQLVVRRVAADFGDVLAVPGEFRVTVNISAAISTTAASMPALHRRWTLPASHANASASTSPSTPRPPATSPCPAPSACANSATTSTSTTSIPAIPASPIWPNSTCTH